MNIKKEDFQVYDKHLNNDGGAYKKLGKGTWYNDEMYQEALKQGQTLPIDIVVVPKGTLVCDCGSNDIKCTDYGFFRCNDCKNEWDLAN